MSGFLTDSRHRATRREVQLAQMGIAGLGTMQYEGPSYYPYPKGLGQIEAPTGIDVGGPYSGYTQPIPGWDPRNPLSSLSDSFLNLFTQPAAMGQGNLQTVGQSPAGYGDGSVSGWIYENRTLVYIGVGAIVIFAAIDAMS